MASRRHKLGRWRIKPRRDYRDEMSDDGPVGIEITAYIDRMPETNEATIGRLSRAWRGVWNSCVGRNSAEAGQEFAGHQNPSFRDARQGRARNP
jgi:hypothetical protein